jgi:phosphatidylglycerol:prolipoprotein diacylglycerol transferase
MHPILFEIGSLPIRSYGLMVAIAFAAAIWLARSRAAARGVVPDTIIDLSFFVIIASIIGARITYVIVHLEYYVNDPLRAFKIWDGGLALYGGMILGVLCGLWFFRRRGIDMWVGADITAPSLALGIGIGRIGCFLNGCCFGHRCELPWAVTFPPVSGAGTWFPGVPLHPTQLYESASALGVMVILLVLDRKRRFPGFLLWTFMLLLSVYRFLIDPLRYYESTSMVVEGAGFDLTSNQLIGIFLALVSIVFLIALSRRPSARSQTP